MSVYKAGFTVRDVNLLIYMYLFIYYLFIYLTQIYLTQNFHFSFTALIDKNIFLCKR